MTTGKKIFNFICEGFKLATCATLLWFVLLFWVLWMIVKFFFNKLTQSDV